MDWREKRTMSTRQEWCRGTASGNTCVNPGVCSDILLAGQAAVRRRLSTVCAVLNCASLGLHNAFVLPDRWLQHGGGRRCESGVEGRGRVSTRKTCQTAAFGSLPACLPACSAPSQWCHPLRSYAAAPFSAPGQRRAINCTARLGSVIPLTPAPGAGSSGVLSSDVQTAGHFTLCITVPVECRAWHHCSSWVQGLEAPRHGGPESSERCAPRGNASGSPPPPGFSPATAAKQTFAAIFFFSAHTHPYVSRSPPSSRRALPPIVERKRSS